MGRIAIVAEGKGEEAALPVLIRRIAGELGCHADMAKPVSAGGGTISDEKLSYYIRLAAGNAGPDGVVLVCFDSEDELPCISGPRLATRVTQVYVPCPLFVQLAYREYETWFVAAAESLARKGKLIPSAAPPADPMAMRSAKDWLSNHMAGSMTYKETTDQASFSALFDMNVARERCPSFARFYRICEEMLTHTAKQPPDQSRPNPA